MTADGWVAAATLAPGIAEGAPFVLVEPLSLWGGLDAQSGRIIDRWHPQHGERICGRILVAEAGRGSSSGSSVLAEAIRLGSGPAGIVLLTRDAIITIGALVAGELYGIACPVVLASAPDWPRIAQARRIGVKAADESARLSLSAAEIDGPPG